MRIGEDISVRRMSPNCSSELHTLRPRPRHHRPIQLMRKSQLPTSVRKKATRLRGAPCLVVQERFERLVALQDDIARQENNACIGKDLELLVLENPGRKDSAHNRLSGRAPDNRLVHFDVPVTSGGEEFTSPRPGDMVTVRVTSAASHHLVAEPSDVWNVRKTPAGDAWDSSRAHSHAHSDASCGPVGTGDTAVALGIPVLRKESH